MATKWRLWTTTRRCHDNALALPIKPQPQPQPTTTTTTTSPLAVWTTETTPGTLEFFRAYRRHLESQLVFPLSPLPNVWQGTLTSFVTARHTVVAAQKVLQELQAAETTTSSLPVMIAQAQKALEQAQQAVQEIHATLCLVGKSLLCNDNDDDDDDDTTDNDEATSSLSIAAFLSKEFDDAAWLSYTVLQNPKHWATWCCGGAAGSAAGAADGHWNDENPNPHRVTLATNFLLDIDWQRCVLGQGIGSGGGGGGPRGGNYGGYLDLVQQLGLAAAAAADQDPVLERLVHAVALEFANHDYCYFDTKTPIDAVARYLHYKQAYLMGDLDPAFATLEIWQLRLAVNSCSTDDELAWGRECLQTYRPDWALTTDEQWRYCRLVRTDVGYVSPTWTSHPRTMDQILSGGGKCGPRAWFGRFMCHSFGVPVWGVRQPGHAAMSRWTASRGWLICLGASFNFSWWEGRCGADFLLETRVREIFESDDYLRLVLRLEWLASLQKESSQSILKDCTYDVAAPWYALSLVQRHVLVETQQSPDTKRIGSRHAPFTRIIPKLERVRGNNAYRSTDSPIVCDSGGVCIPADNTITETSNKVMIMPSFTGGRQVFLGQDATLEYKLKQQWLPVKSQTYRLSAKVAVAHTKETALLIRISSKRKEATATEDSNSQSREECYRLPLPYTKGLWGQTECVEIKLCAATTKMSLQREFQSYGIALKELRLEPC